MGAGEVSGGAGAGAGAGRGARDDDDDDAPSGIPVRRKNARVCALVAFSTIVPPPAVASRHDDCKLAAVSPLA